MWKLTGNFYFLTVTSYQKHKVPVKSFKRQHIRKNNAIVLEKYIQENIIKLMNFWGKQLSPIFSRLSSTLCSIFLLSGFLIELKTAFFKFRTFDAAYKPDPIWVSHFKGKKRLFWAIFLKNRGKNTHLLDSKHSMNSHSNSESQTW